MTLLDCLALADHGSRPAISTVDRRWRADDLDREADGWAAAVAGALPSQATVALRFDDPLTFTAAILGTWRAGCGVVPLDPGRSATDVVGALDHSRAELLASDRSEPALERRVEALGVPILRQPGGRGVARPPGDGDPALLLYTSGTTGEPKCVVFSHLAMARNVDALITAAGFRAEDHLFSPLGPGLTTVLASCVLPGLRLGAQVTLPGRFLPLQTRRLLRDGGVSVLLAVPYVYHLLAQLPGSDELPQLRLCITNSAPMTPALAMAFEERFGMLPRSNYCSSEAGGITYNAAPDRERTLSSVGTPLPGVRVTIADHGGRPVPPGVEGQVVVKSPMAATGYLDQPQATAQVFREGRIWTDDVGTMDAEGYLRITGRLSIIVNVAGNLVNPEEVESVLTRHPAVAEALVLGQEDAAASETLTAMIVPRGDVDLGRLREYCLRELASHKVPRRFELVASLPRDRLGKLQRRVRVPA